MAKSIKRPLPKYKPPQSYIDNILNSPNSIMRILLTECFSKITPAEEITSENIKDNFDIIESYMYAVFSIQTGLTEIPQIAFDAAAEDLADWALKIPDRKLAKKFIASFGKTIARQVLQNENWNKENGNHYFNRYEQRRKEYIEYYKEYNGPISIKGEYTNDIYLPDPQLVKTEEEAISLGMSVTTYISEEKNINRLNYNLHRIYQWSFAITDNIILNKLLSIMVKNEKARSKMLINESWIFFSNVIKPRIL